MSSMGSRPRLVISQLSKLRNGSLHPLFYAKRHYSWNPFRKPSIKTSIEHDTDETVLSAKQELRGDITKERLAELLLDLANNPSKAARSESFLLMNDILKKLDQKTEQEAIIPTLSLKDTHSIFQTVVLDIDTSNYTAARFVPRLYLQLVDAAIKSNDNDLLLNTFSGFVRYLSVLGYGDQLSQVIESFVKQNNSVLSTSFQSVKKTLLSLDGLHPSIYIKVYNVYEWLGLKRKTLSSFSNVVLDHSLSYYTKRDSLFSIDEKELDITREFLGKILKQGIQPVKLLKIIDICQIDNHLESQLGIASEKLVQLVSSSNDFSSFDLHQLESISKTIISSSSLTKDQASSITSKILKHLNTFPISSESVNLRLQLDAFITSSLSSSSIDFLLKNRDLIDSSTLNSILLGLSYTKDPKFTAKLDELVDFFELEFPEIFRNIDFFTILINLAIRDSSYSNLKSYYEESLQNGVDWKANTQVLFKFLTKLAEEPNANIPDVFQWYKRIKLYVDYLDAESYNAMMKLFLKNDVEDAITSMKHEFPPLENSVKFQKDNYLELFQTVSTWMIQEATEVDDIWDMYTALDKYFDIPFDLYGPIIKRFVDMKRPDHAFDVFQQIKKRHRTTGSIPPPPPELYTYLFKNFGHELYADGVHYLHMILNIDLHINSDINVMNSVLGAYSNLQDVQQVLDIYDQIKFLPNGKGLNNETASIMLKTMTYISLDHVQSFWNNLDTINVLPNSQNYNQLIIAYCCYEEYDAAFEIASTIEEFDVKMTPQIIETLYTWTKDEEKRLLIKEWASQNHKPIWKSLESKIANVPALTDQKSDENLDIVMGLIKTKI